MTPLWNSYFLTGISWCNTWTLSFVYRGHLNWNHWIEFVETCTRWCHCVPPIFNSIWLTSELLKIIKTIDQDTEWIFPCFCIPFTTKKKMDAFFLNVDVIMHWLKYYLRTTYRLASFGQALKTGQFIKAVRRKIYELRGAPLLASGCWVNFYLDEAKKNEFIN